MAIQAAPLKIRDAFFIMLLGHFVLVVAGKTVVLGTPGRVAFAAFAISISMVHGKTVVEGNSTPGGGSMTLRALPIEMVIWLFPAMAGFAICRSCRSMVEGRT
jgi:hypothetical protein